ncbi:hypothetical protein K469DRAFT_702916, partial [Zopfia rhizophila CBS 207.26]
QVMGVCCLDTGLRVCRALKFNLSHSLTTIRPLSTPAIVTGVRTYFSKPTIHQPLRTPRLR